MKTPQEILAEAKTIAIVGASPKPWRPSHDVMGYLLEQGFEVIPVNPRADEVLGIPCIASLRELERPVDLVDVFRRPEYTPDVAREAVEADSKELWLQMGIVSEEARQIAEAGGLDYVENACTKVVHKLYIAA